jgi:hypothetical protein
MDSIVRLPGLPGLRGAALAVAAVLAAGCGGNGSSSSGTAGVTGSVHVLVSDDPSTDWAMIGVKVEKIALVPQGGGAPVTVFTAQIGEPLVNLVQLDGLADLMDEAVVPVGTYVAAVVTVGANPGDVVLTPSADPDPAFAGSIYVGSSCPAGRVFVQNAVGPVGSKIATVRVSLDEPLVVTEGQTSPLDLEFDLSHPVFIVDHTPAGMEPFWFVNFDGPVRHRPVRDLRRLVLRDGYGVVTAVDAGGGSFSALRVLPEFPPTTPEQAIATNREVHVLADAVNGTILYDLDPHFSATVVRSFPASLDGKYVRVAARYQPDGSLVAVRVWESSKFNRVWLNPEGHVLHVNLDPGVAGTLVVSNERGHFDRIGVDANTSFFFRTPERAVADATPIGTGFAFLPNLKRGFKVHVDVDPDLAPTTLLAKNVDIEIARFDGSLGPATPGTSFKVTRTFPTAQDDYVQTLDYLSAATTNGKDANGNDLYGFKWWNFAYPTQVESGAPGITDFESILGGSVDFGGHLAGAWKPFGLSYATWGDAANPSGWSADLAILLPTRYPWSEVTVAGAYSAASCPIPGNATCVGTFAMKALYQPLGLPLAVDPTGTAVTVDVSGATGSATLVYDVNTSGMGMATTVTVTPVDPTTSAGQTELATELLNPARVRVFGVPQADGSIKAYVLFFFTNN